MNDRIVEQWGASKYSWNECTVEDFQLIKRISGELVNIHEMSNHGIADIRSGFGQSLTSHTKSNVVAVSRADSAAARRQIPAPVSTADVQRAIVPASAPDEMKVIVCKWLRIAGVGLSEIRDPFIGIAYHIHTPIRAGPIWITAYGSTLIRSISAAGGIVVFGIIALFRVPGITPWPGVCAAVLLVPSRSFLPLGFSR